MTQEQRQDIHNYMDMVKSWVERGPSIIDELTDEYNKCVKEVMQIIETEDPSDQDVRNRVIALRDWVTAVKAFQDAIASTIALLIAVDESKKEARQEFSKLSIDELLLRLKQTLEDHQ